MNFTTYTFTAAALTLGTYMIPVSTPTSLNAIDPYTNICGQYTFKKAEVVGESFDNNTTDLRQSINIGVETVSTDLFNLDQKPFEDYYNVNTNALVSSFYKDYTKNFDLITVDQNVLFAGFNQLAFKLAAIDFNIASVELLRDNGIKFSLKLDDDRILLITNSLVDADELKSDDIVISLFRNKKRIVSDVFKIDEFVEGFNRYLTS